MSGENLDEEIIPEDEAEASPGAIKKLRDRLTQALKEKQEYLEGWQRSRAEFSNLKRDEEMRRGHSEVRIRASLTEEIIPVLDSFELALSHSKSEEVEVLHNQLVGALKKMGVAKYGAEGDIFDPRRFEALREEPTDEEEKDHTVASVFRSGYAIDDYVIRPAQVSVLMKK